jgi:iron(III) transport system ATP-binding protein
VIRIKNVVKTFQTEHETVQAVRDVSFDAAEGAFYTLLGPSGCGKTTILRCIAGLEHPDAGEIWLGDTMVFSSAQRLVVPPERRGIGMVFQSYAIWPHLKVFDNVAFPVQEGPKRFSRAEIRERVMTALEMVQLEKLEKRDATQLSGGQQQRLALARALVSEPKVMLLDEPLSNLDAKLRGEMRLELRELQRRIRITTLYVTHDQIEALTMSNKIAVLRDGQIIQVGSPREIYLQPNSGFVASFTGSTNLIPGSFKQVGDGGMVETQIGSFRCARTNNVKSGDNVLLAIQPVNVAVYHENDNNPNVVQGTVDVVIFCGDFLDCEVRVGPHCIFCRPHPSMEIRRGQKVYVEFPPRHCTAVALDA